MAERILGDAAIASAVADAEALKERLWRMTDIAEQDDCDADDSHVSTELEDATGHLVEAIDILRALLSARGEA